MARSSTKPNTSPSPSNRRPGDRSGWSTQLDAAGAMQSGGILSGIAMLRQRSATIPLTVFKYHFLSNWRNSTGAPFSTIKATVTPGEGELGAISISFPAISAERSSTWKATCGTVRTSSGTGASGSNASTRFRRRSVHIQTRRWHSARSGVHLLDARQWTPARAQRLNASGTGGRCSPSPSPPYGRRVRSLRGSRDQP